MNTYKYVLLACLLSIFKSYAQTDAQSIFQKHVDAIGGKATIQSITDMTLSMTTETPRGVSETEMKFKMPLKYALSVYAGGQQMMSSTYNGIQLVSSSPWGGAQKPIEGDLAKAEILKNHPFAELYFEEAGVKVIASEQIDMDGKSYQKVVLGLGTTQWTNFYDLQTGLKYMTVAENKTPRGTFESKSIFTDYKKFKGSEILFAAKRQQTTGMGAITSELQSIKINKGLKDKEFEN